jgi:hypothetical protein
MREANLAMMEAISTLLEALPEPSLRYIRGNIDRKIRDLNEERSSSENSVTIPAFGMTSGLTSGLIPLIKRLRELTGMGLIESKDLIVNGGVVEIRGEKDRNDFIKLLTEK